MLCSQGRIQEFAKGGRFPFSPFLSPFPLSFPSLPLKPAKECGERCKLPQWGPPKTNSVHIKAARKPLVPIVLHILSTMYYSRSKFRIS